MLKGVVILFLVGGADFLKNKFSTTLFGIQLLLEFCEQLFSEHNSMFGNSE